MPQSFQSKHFIQAKWNDWILLDTDAKYSEKRNNKNQIKTCYCEFPHVVIKFYQDREARSLSPLDLDKTIIIKI